MKTEDGATAEKHGDVSPITGSISNLADAPTPEPTSEKLNNFSRVTPAQMAHITFPPDSRYQPVRLVSPHPAPTRRSFKSLATEKFAGGGGILLLVDQRPSEEASYVEFSAPAPAPAAAEEPRADSPVRHIALDADAPEADPPEPFEVSVLIPCMILLVLTSALSCSTRSITILRRNSDCVGNVLLLDCIQYYFFTLHIPGAGLNLDVQLT